MGPTVADALAGARYQAPANATRKTVLLVGAAARLGEKLLIRLLGAPHYQRIYVLVVNPMPSTEAKLTPVTSTEWNFRIDEIIAVVDDSPESAAPRLHKRAEIFCSLMAEEVMPIACQAKVMGATRFTLVTPTASLSQPAAIHGQLANLMDVQLLQLGFDEVVLVRPANHAIQKKQQGVGQRFWNLLVNTATSLMVGPKSTPLSLDGAARAIVMALQHPAPGTRILETEHLHEMLQPRQASQAPAKH